MCDDGFDRADEIDMIRRLIEGSGMTSLEAMVWLQRTGVLDPGGHGTELPDIAADLGLEGRAEARAGTSPRSSKARCMGFAEFLCGVLERMNSKPTPTKPGKDVRVIITRR